MRSYIEGEVSLAIKAALKLGASNKEFLVNAKKQRKEKLPKIIKKKYKVLKNEVMNHRLYTINADASTHKHILYFHGGSLCLNGTIAHHLLIDKLITHTKVKVTYMVYPLIPKQKTSEIYRISYEMIKKVMIQFPDDEFILMGDSAGGLVILSAYQLFNQQEQSRIKRIILLSPWLDFSLSNPKMKDIEKNDFMLAVDQFNGLNAYDDISQTMQFQSPMDFQYDKPIDIYVGTYDILYPDTCLFEERNPDVNLMIFEKHPHVFALLPMKKAKIVTQKMIETINKL